MDIKQQLTLILPEEMAGLPIVVVKGSEPGKIILASHPDESNVAFADSPEKKYTFIWKLNGYAKVKLEDILWVKAEGSYSTIHLAHGNDMTVSFNLATIGRKLPASDFVRIHRSYIVNLRHVEAMTGNSFRIGGQLLVIGREFREQVLGRFIFLGVRRERRGPAPVRDFRPPSNRFSGSASQSLPSPCEFTANHQAESEKPLKE